MPSPWKAAPFLLVSLLAVGVAHAQEPPPVDMTDPQAVAEAYVKACLDGDLETALALMAPDDPLRQFARAFIGEFRRDMEAEGYTLNQFMTEFLFMPMKLGFDYQLLDTQRQDGQAQVTLRRTFGLDQRLQLAKVEDGTWRVKVLDSVKATTGVERSFLAREIGGGAGPDVYRSRSNLAKLQQTMQEYAQEHDQRLPPADRWVDEIEPYLLDRSALKCPAAPDLEYGYAMNAEASEADITDRGALRDMPLLFEWPSGERNAIALPEELAVAESLRPDGSIACASGDGSTYVLPKGMTFADVRAAEQLSSECSGHLMRLAQAARKYARDHDGLLPSAENWQDELALYLLEAGGGEEIFMCPAAPDLDIAYAINRELAGKRATELTDHDRLILFFESDLNVPNAAGTPEADMPKQARHLREWDGDPGNNIVYLSGSGTLQAALQPAAEE
jgi:hypothetical protein